MQRTQIQLTEEQARALKQLAAKEGTSVAELIRISVDALLRRSGSVDLEERYKRAVSAAGKLREGPKDLSAEHDKYLQEAYGS